MPKDTLADSFYLKNITRGYGNSIVSFAIYSTLLFDPISKEKKKEVGHVYCHFALQISHSGKKIRCSISP